MKQSRVTAGSFAALLNPLAGLSPLAVLSPFAGIAASLAGALPARGGDVPFTEHVISTTALNAQSVFATDVDGDGDTDVLYASKLEDKIAWYENLSPCGFDSNCDGDVDLDDFALFQVGFAGPKNLPDFALLLEAFTGPQ